MIGLLIAAHGGLGQGLLDAAVLILGPQAQATAIGVFPGDGREDIVKKIRQGLEQIDGPEGTLVLCDMLGGSPHQVCTLLSEKKGIEVVFGANLPMVVEFFMSRGSMDLAELTIKVNEAGIKGIRGVI